MSKIVDFKTVYCQKNSLPELREIESEVGDEEGGFLDFLRLHLSEEAEQRRSSTELLNHAFFQSAFGSSRILQVFSPSNDDLIILTNSSGSSRSES